MAQVIYKIINTSNGKFYVGSSNNVKERFRAHRKLLLRGGHHCKHLQAAWNKYGADAFLFRTVEEVPDDMNLQAAEDRWLAEHFGKEHCYNTGRSADAPHRGAPKESHPQFGIPKSAETRQKISGSLKAQFADGTLVNPNKGVKYSEERRASMSAARMGQNAGAEHYRYGKTLSAEVREKIGAAQRGVKKGPRTYTPDGLARAQENMRRHAKPQSHTPFAAVLAKFPVAVQQRYDFTNAVYRGALERITGVVCLEHGEFSQVAAQFRKGSGCPTCGALVRGAKVRAMWADPAKKEMMRVALRAGHKKGNKFTPT